MKIYLVVEKIQGEDDSVNLYHAFEKRDTAKKYFNSLVAKHMDSGYDTKEVEEEYAEIYNEGFYNQGHIVLSLRELEVDNA